jgi:hypothetical protein
MKRLVIRIGGIVLLLLVTFLGLQWFASERVEVVVLQTRDASGALEETRLWVVDHDGALWIRAGGVESGWYQRVAAQPMIELTRAETHRVYQAAAVPEQRAAINALMRAKYGWGDRFISWMIGGRDDAVPVRLEPARAEEAN